MRGVRAELETVRRLIERIRNTVQATTFEQFELNRDSLDAVAYRLAMIGEHCRRLPPELQERHPDIMWKAMSGLRNIVSHAYDLVDAGIIWRTARDHLDKLERMCREELGLLDASDRKQSR
jgi:uncharacterized protein with HEPN domain